MSHNIIACDEDCSLTMKQFVNKTEMHNEYNIYTKTINRRADRFEVELYKLVCGYVLLSSYFLFLRIHFRMALYRVISIEIGEQRSVAKSTKMLFSWCVLQSHSLDTAHLYK